MNEDKNGRKFSEDDFFHKIDLADNFESDDDYFADISESLKKQVNDELGLTAESTFDYDGGAPVDNQKVKKKTRYKAIKITGVVILCFSLVIAFFIGTKPGRKLLYNWSASYVASRLDNDQATTNEDNTLFVTPTIDINPGEAVNSMYRRENYVANFLLFGIEEIGGGGRTDSIMIASVNIKDNTVKLTSIMRDCYVEIPGHDSNKINAAYALGDEELLVDTVEQNFKIHIDGWASVNFEAFEAIVDMLGGVDIELGETEANYLNTTNYISNPAYRNVSAGWNTLNGNQALGYARVRKVSTLGGTNNDYGRTVRQRRLLNSIFEKYKSKNFIELFSIMNDILPMIKTNLSASQISDVLEQIVENNIKTIQEFRLPADDSYEDGNNEHGFVLLLDFEENIDKLYQFIFLDPPPVTPTPTGEPTITPTVGN
jgi:LCP family protein required for cell wall assembly